MICEVCQSENATVHLTQIISGKMQKIDLCEKCAKEKGVADPAGFSLADMLLGLGAADEIFLTGTGAEVVPISEVDGRKIGPGRVGAITQEFIHHFRDRTQNTGVPIY